MRYAFIWVSIAIGALPVPAPAQKVNFENRGIVGLCVRWGVDTKHIEDAVVVVPSAQPAFDADITAMLRERPWKRPAEGYNGEWVGIWMVVREPFDRSRPLPDCSGLSQPHVPGDIPTQPSQ